MNVLIIYGTTEGQTRKITRFMADRVRERGYDVTLIDSTDLPKRFDIGSFDVIMAAGSVHQGHHQASLFQFVRDHLEDLQARPTAFVSVSLSMASEDDADRRDAAECADRFLDVAGWTPTVTHLVAGALRYSQYDFFKGWILKAIAGAKGASTDTSKDHEFTDWQDLDAFVDAFLGQLCDHPIPVNDMPRKDQAGEGEKPAVQNQSASRS